MGTPARADPFGARCRAHSALSSVAGALGALDASYELTPGVRVDPSVGFLTLGVHRTETAARLLVPMGPAPSDSLGTLSEAFSLTGALVGASLAVQREGAFHITGRFGAGFLLGSLSDTRSGFFSDAKGMRYPTRAVTRDEGLGYVYLHPELWGALRLTDRLEIGVGSEGCSSGARAAEVACPSAGVRGQ